MTAQPAKADLAAIVDTLEAALYRKTYRRRDFFVPYKKQLEFYAHGTTKRERLLDAGTQLGKTEAGAFETTCHLTGEYPDWWPGRRWDRPTKGWMAGETSTLVRDVQQKKICGEPGVEDSLGTGMIPKAAFADKPSLARGVTDAFDTIQVEHSVPEVKKGNYIKTRCRDGISIGRFKSYEQGRTKFQGDTLDWVWEDEEPPNDIHAECLARVTSTAGMTYITFTPLQGRSTVVMRFWDEPSPDRAIVIMTIDDVVAEPHGHIKADERDRIVAGYLPHEREARALGIPVIGGGRIFLASEESITEAPIERVPSYWAKLWGVDFGIGHPFAAVLILWDRDNDVIHVHHCIRIADALPIMHAAAMKPIGAAVPVAWPHDGTVREKTSGDTLASHYKKHDLLMLADHATWADGGISTEAGILEMDERMQTGRFKVAAHLRDWFEEYRFYHRKIDKDGRKVEIVKIKDDLLSATRVAVMMKRFARVVELGAGAKPPMQPIQFAPKFKSMRRKV